MGEPLGTDTHNRASDDRLPIGIVHAAAQGDVDAQRQVNAVAHPLITFHTNKLCRQFCYGNRYRFRCSLPHPLSGAPDDAAGCEWGNASYGWMLEELVRPERLARFDGREGAGIQNYLFTIASSLPFFERWKDWRFGRRVHVPCLLYTSPSPRDS